MLVKAGSDYGEKLFLGGDYMYKVAIIGAGNIAGIHAESYKYISNTELVAVVDIDLEKAEKMAFEYDLHAYESFDKMVNSEKVDIIDICLPSYLHKEYVIKALKHEFNVICEKPIALNSMDAVEILNEKKKSKCKFMVAHCLRFANEYNFLKKCLENNTYGKLNHIKMFRHVSMPKEMEKSWIFDVNKSGGIVMDLHIHDVDMLNFLLGEPVDYNRYVSERFVDSIYEYDDVIATAEASWRPQEKFGFKAGYDAVFEGASISCTNGEIEIITDKNCHIEKIDDLYGETVEEYIKMYCDEIKYFIECIENDKETSVCTAEDSYISLQMVLN